MTITIHDQTDLLPHRLLLIVFAALASSLLISYIDQSAIGIALPTIGKDLNSSSTIVWAGTSSMIANASFQVLYGRLSDIFGRKIIILSAISLLVLGDLLCGFAKTGAQLYAFRGICGVANGGIMAICMMIVSDIVTLEDRGKYQGILGSCVGLGNILGPFIAAGFIHSSSWRYQFFLVCPLAAIVGIVIFILLPASKIPEEPLKEKLNKIDYLGIITSSAAIILILIPISGLGAYFDIQSPMVISMLILGSISAVAFIFNESKLARLPMIPLRLFTTPALSAMLLQNIFIGITYYGILYYLPIYFQTVRQWSPLLSAALIVPLTGVQAVSSSSSGYYITKMGSYGEVIWLGYGLWTLAAGLHYVFSRHTHPVAIAFILAIEGFGVGCVFQPTLIAAQAHGKKEDRAVVISTRNFLRSMGGAIGLAISGSIFSNILRSNLSRSIPAELREAVLASIFFIPELTGVSADTKDAIFDSYLAAMKGVFILWVCCIGTCFLLTSLVKDRGLKRKEEVLGHQESTSDSILDGSAKADKKSDISTELKVIDEANAFPSPSQSTIPEESAGSHSQPGSGVRNIAGGI
ncbi:major facilitator superfamily domain-containing protein [Tricladium varicosporioides]|nr:major facilitator superfamily domain-containing protein [Hymenoscyphus varicosporioides]